jgi:hypothetical protein
VPALFDRVRALLVASLGAACGGGNGDNETQVSPTTTTTTTNTLWGA